MDTMEITTQIGCKNNCLYCPQDKLIKAYAKRSNSYKMSFDVFKTCLDKIPRHINIGFAGMCEPWLNPDCTKMLIYAHNKGHGIEVFTTLVGMASVDIEQLENIPVKEFWVHLPSEGNYEHIVVDESYLSVLDKLCKSKNNASYLYNGNKLNSKVASLLESNGKESVRNNLITRANNISGDIINKSNTIKIKGFINCRRKHHYNILLPNGDVILCCMDYGMKHILGNLLFSSYESLFRGEEFIKIRKGRWNTSTDILCRYCDECAYNVVRKFCKNVLAKLKGNTTKSS
jgi:hypothetical protein